MAGFSGPQPPERFNMADYVVGRAARAAPDKVALEVMDDAAAETPAERWTYRQLEAAILGIAGGLQARGVKQGDRVLIRLDNTSAYALSYFGAIAGGFIAVPTSNALTETEADFLLADSGARCIIGTPVERAGDGVVVVSTDEIATMIAEGASRAVAYASTRAHDPAYMVYTSGTTSRPKGVLHAQRAAWGRRPMVEGWCGLTADDRMLHAGAFNWTFTLGVGLTDPWANAATAIVFTGEKTPAVWPRLIAATGATLFAGVPSVFRQILKYGHPTPAAFGRLRHGLIAGEAPPPDLFEAWLTATGRPLYEAFGMSEISTFISSSATAPRKAGTIGRAQAGRCVAILPVDEGDAPLPPGEEGLLAVHRTDPGFMLGYWRRPEEDAAVRRGDWFAGGDLAVMDADGYVAYRGRADDIMKALGYRVAPQEVEAVLAAMPGVADVACAEVRVRPDLCVIGAVVVPVPGTGPDAPAILAAAKKKLAAYKVPREVVFAASLPRTANGKLRRKDLEPLFAGCQTGKTTMRSALSISHAALADALLPAVLEAARVQLSHFKSGTAVETKADRSPVTEADRGSERVLLNALAAIAPGIPVVAEEAMAAGACGAVADGTTGEFFLVDPLDGTREFVAGRDEFTINVALVRDRVPRFGLIYAPALGNLYVTLDDDVAVEAAVDPDSGARRVADTSPVAIHAREAPASGLIAAASRSHDTPATEAFLARLPIAYRIATGSSLKFALVARGDVDVYARGGPTSEWDTGAGHALVVAAGGLVTAIDGGALLYGKASSRFLNSNFVAWGRGQPKRV